MMKNNDPEKAPASLDDPRPTWCTPVLVEDSIVDATEQFYSSGIDNYESSNPVAYGS